MSFEEDLRAQIEQTRVPESIARRVSGELSRRSSKPRRRRPALVIGFAVAAAAALAVFVLLPATDTALEPDETQPATWRQVDVMKGAAGPPVLELLRVGQDTDAVEVAVQLTAAVPGAVQIWVFEPDQDPERLVSAVLDTPGEYVVSGPPGGARLSLAPRMAGQPYATFRLRYGVSYRFAAVSGPGYRAGGQIRDDVVGLADGAYATGSDRGIMLQTVRYGGPKSGGE